MTRRTAWIWLVAAALLIILGIATLGGQPLDPWHMARLQTEYTANKSDEVTSFAEYLALEQRVFDELDREIYDTVATGDEQILNRYSSGSIADPRNRTPDFNRTFDLDVDAPRGGVLLLHGLTDSPYSLRALGVRLNQLGYRVVGLRLPGHGTVPAALRHSNWQDWAAAAGLAWDYLRDELGDKPVHIAGYSTGAALALEIAINAVENGAKAPASLILVSPAVGVSATAALARPIALLGRIPGFGRLVWADVIPEFDPYKYNSFPVNAGAQVHQLTENVATRISRLVSSGRANEFPPLLTFKSAVDATVSTDALVDRLLGRLPDNGNELVLFDINRAAIAAPILVADPGPFTNRLVADGSLPFALRLITSESPVSGVLVERYKSAYSYEFASVRRLALSWPPGVISLSHVALPFPPDDPLYGQDPPQEPGQLYLGQIDIRGERGLLRLSSDWLLRLRYNPFYSVLEERVVEWVSEVGP